VKKIALYASDDFDNAPIVFAIQKNLSNANIKVEQIKEIESADSINYEGLILLGQAHDSMTAKNLITAFHSASKPIVGFGDSAKMIARILKNNNPVIAVNFNDSDKMILKKMGIDTEDCPADDFITDRYTKLISSPYSPAHSVLDASSEKGLHRLCKELVEMC
jgi:enhancing lycopene biosynthesis protein 2